MDDAVVRESFIITWEEFLKGFGDQITEEDRRVIIKNQLNKILENNKEVHSLEDAAEIIADYQVNGCGYCHEGGPEVEESFNVAIKMLRLLSAVYSHLE